ncbi:MAG: ABC transporter substrate-binding protein [Actinomycetota bacterium]
MKGRGWLAAPVMLSLLASGCYSTQVRVRRVPVPMSSQGSPGPQAIGGAESPNPGAGSATRTQGRHRFGPTPMGVRGATEVGVTSSSIKLGFIGDFTGQARAFYGGVFDGANAYVADLNARGGINGRRVQIVYYTASYQSPDQVLAAARRLVEEDEVFAVVAQGEMRNASTSAIPYYNERGVPCVGCSSASQQDLALGPANFEIKIAPTNEGTIVGNFIAKRLKKTRMAIGYCPSAWSHQVRDAVTSSFQKEGGEVVDQRDIGACDQTSMESTVSAWYSLVPRPDVVTVIDPIGMAEGAAAARRMGWDVQFTGAGGMYQLVLDIGGSQTEGLISTTGGFAPPGYQTPQMARYRRVLNAYYPNRTEEEPTLYAWISLSFFEEAARRAGAGLTRRGLIQALNGMGGWDSGLGAVTSYSPERHWAFAKTSFFRIHDQAFEKATPEDFLSAEDQ